MATRPNNRLFLGAVLALAGLVAGAPLASATTTAPGTTSVPVLAEQARSQGSGQWGYVGDIDTRAGATWNYGLAFDPTDESLAVSDSGKLLFSRFGCRLAGFSTSSCQVGTPRVFDYSLHGPTAGVDEAAFTQYVNDGTFVATAVASTDDGQNSGLGKKYDTVASRASAGFPPDESLVHGPRGVTYTPDGTLWVVDSEAVAPASGPAGVVKRFGQGLTSLPGAGWSGPWADRAKPGIHFYRTGAATTPRGTVLVTSEVSDRLQEYAADGTWLRTITLDVPRDSVIAGDPGTRDPYGVAVDPVDGSMYLALATFQDDAFWKTQPAFLEKRDADGKVIATFGQGHLGAGQVVFGAAVEPKTRDVFVWTATGSLQQFTKDGVWLREFTSAEFPGLETVRGVAFDPNGRMYVTVAEGTSRARVMILGKTPDPVTAATCALTARGISLSWQSASKTASGVAAPYQQSTLLDFVVERSPKGTQAWAVVPKGAPSTELTRTIDGADAASFDYRISAWNEAGNGDTATVTCANPAPGVAVSKSINGIDKAPWPTVAPGASLSVGFTVTNTGNSALADVAVSDVIEGGENVSVSCPKDVLAVGESMSCTALTLTAPSAGAHKDSATVRALGVGLQVVGSAEASATVGAVMATPMPTPTPTPSLTTTPTPSRVPAPKLSRTGLAWGDVGLAPAAERRGITTVA